MDFSFWNG
ncbi:hypothetical protein Taro_051761, partial [Colocasia esculenta]|nr:hypothetical protein [Colocasia esculenta]